jgi:nitrogen fixation protein
VNGARVATLRGDEAVVDVDLEGGARGQVTMRREPEGWRLVLPAGG